MTFDNIPLDIKGYLQEIAERLWTGHASVMIGAGFSKNAYSKNPAQKALPSWNELGDIFYQKIHGVSPSPQDRYLNPLKLADEIQATFGRAVLDQLLRKHIDDKAVEPSDLHHQLLELPWTDIFTTNYDTLLERGCENVIDRRYDIVINQDDIIHSDKPRIIKLHGSFPSERPLIITEEDYRIYSKKFAPFVNTVQQSLLENTLCLLGFSGDDPNFLQWMGWINDNIGKENSPKVFLIGILRLSEGQKKLLSSKNIVPVDLSVWPETKSEHKLALQAFLKYLSSQRNKRENLEWPLQEPRPTHIDSTTAPVFLQEWERSRLAYPNWVILPQELRERLWLTSDSLLWSVDELLDLPVSLDINVVYELNWRCERCLQPLFNHLAPAFQAILDRYNPFPVELPEGKRITYPNTNNGSINWKDLRYKWISLSLSLLRYYREEGHHDLWQKLFESLQKILNFHAPEQVANFYYEWVLKLLFDYQIENAKKVLSDWPTNYYYPFWEAKRAGLLAEFGQRDESLRILEHVLTSIRKNLNLTPIENDYKGVSEEAYVMFLFRFVAMDVNHSKGRYYRDDTSQSFFERWLQLLQFKCDPLAEKKYYDIRLKAPYVVKRTKNSKNEFELSQKTTTYSMNSFDPEVLLAYSYLRFTEEIGIPLSLRFVNFNNETLNGSLQRVAVHSPLWALSIIGRCQTTKVVDSLFHRNFLALTTTAWVDATIQWYLNKFYALEGKQLEDHLIQHQVEKTPLILSRLCVKCSDPSKMELFKFYHVVANLPHHFDHLDKFLINLCKSSDNAILNEALPFLFNIPTPKDSVSRVYSFPEPVDYIDHLQALPGVAVPNAIIEDLIVKARSLDGDRKRALKRLYFLKRKGLLNEANAELFVDALWSQRDKQVGFPADTLFHVFGFLKIGAPKNIDVRSMFINMIDKSDFYVQALQKETEEISPNPTLMHFSRELLNGSASMFSTGVEWSEEQLQSILAKCTRFWDLDKEFLAKEEYKLEAFGHSLYQTVFERLNKIPSIIARIFGHQKSKLSNPTDLQRIGELIRDMEGCLPVLQAKVMFYDLLYKDGQEYLDDLRSAFQSIEQVITFDAMESAILVYLIRPHTWDSSVYEQLLDILVQPLQWFVQNLMEDILKVLTALSERTLVSQNELIAKLEQSCTPLMQKLDYNVDNLSIETKISIKMRAVALARTLAKQFGINQPLPDFIMQWRAVAQDSNEFGEVTAKWETDGVTLS